MNIARFHPAIVITMLILLASSLAGCAKPFKYQAYDDSNGYFDSPIRRNAYEVSYVGATDSQPQFAIIGAKIRAAELAESHGRPYFEVLASRDDVHSYTVYIPPTYTSFPQTYVDSNGNSHTVWTQIMTSPGRWETHTVPICTLIVQLTEANSLTVSYIAADILRDARERKWVTTENQPARGATTTTRPSS